MCDHERAERARPPVDCETKLWPTPQASGQARRFVRDHLIAWGFPALVDNAMVVVAELVTNAVAAAPCCPLWVSMRLANGIPILEVQDCSSELPAFREPDYLSESGRGLHIAQALSALLGWTPVTGGKVVWCLLDTTPPTPVNANTTG